MQNLFNQDLSNSQTAANTAGQLGTAVQGDLSKNVDLGPGATQAYLDKLNTQTLDPQWQQAQTQLNQQLADQGLTPGSEGWKYQQTQFGNEKANAYNSMYLQGQNTAVNDILAQYNEPLNALNALQSQSQVSQPGIGSLAPTPQAQIQPAPYASTVTALQSDLTSQYNAQTAANASEMGGLFGIGGDLLKGGLGMLSDRKDKKDVEKLGEKGGLPIYAYRYKDDKPGSVKTVGPMAQDVEKANPGSTFGIGGHRVIKRSAS
jgi:Chaperone of endosialidase